MSAAHSNTHQSPYSSSRGGKYSRASAASSSSAEESAEFKALRSKYSSILKTLHEMFPDWTDADLLYAIQEADGNLETTIAHIAEGFAPQWGEVKSRKDKRQAAKHHQDDSRPFEKTSYVPRPASFRGGVRGGAARGGRGGYSHAPSTRGKPAPAASAKAPAPASNADNSAAGWDAEPADTKSSGAWGAGPAVSDSKPKEPASAPAPAASTPAKPAPMSWASIAKRGAQHVAPEPAQPAEPAQKTAESAQEEPQKPPKEETKPEANTAEAVLEEKPESDEVAAAASKEDEEETPAAAEEEKEETSKAEAADEEATAPEAEAEPISTQQPAAEAETQETGTEELQSASAAAAKRPVSNSRRLNQDAPVVMPSGNATLERIGMQFGSLSIGGVELNTPRTAAAAASAIVSAAPGPDKPAVEAIAPQTEVKEPAAAAPAPAPVQAPAKAEAATTIPETTPAASQGPLTTYLQQQQQQQQQQQHSQTQAQASASASASAISQMPLPNDYGAAALYGSDAQRNNMMGFYDNYGYGQFVANKDDASAAASAAGSQPSATGAHQAVGVNGTSNLSQAGLFPQQIPQPFSMNPGLPYYNPYYYNMMQPGSQFPNPAAFGNNPALAAAYGQPFMKQGMYPMYPGATPQGLQSTVGSHSQQQSTQQPQQPSQQQASQQGQASGQQASQQQASQQQQQQSGVKPSVGAQSNAGAYGNLNTQKAGNPYGHYSANMAAGFGSYEQDPAALSNSPQQFGLGGIPGIFSASKTAGKDPNAKGIPPAATAVMGGTTYYSTPQQVGGYPGQLNSSHPQGFGHHQQPYYNPYAQTYGQTQTPHMYQQPQHQQHQHQQHQHQHQQHQHQQPPQQPHQQSNKQYWEKQ